MHSTSIHSTEANVFIFQMERLRERKGENGLFSCRGKLILDAELDFRNLHFSSVLSQQPESTKQDQFHRLDQWDRETHFYRCDFVCVCVCEICRPGQTFLALLGTSSSRWAPLGVVQAVLNWQNWGGCHHMFQITALTASCSFWCGENPGGAQLHCPELAGTSTVVEIAETTNMCRHTGKGHSGKGFFPVLPSFSSISAVSKSAVQRQKAAQQSCDGIAMKDKTSAASEGSAMKTVLGSRQMLSYSLFTPAVFSWFQPRFGSVETVFKAAISRGEGRDQRVWLKKVAWSEFIMLLRVCNEGCWFSCVPLPQAFTQRIFLDSVPEGGKNCISFQTLLSFSLFDSSCQRGMASDVFLSSKGP